MSKVEQKKEMNLESLVNELPNYFDNSNIVPTNIHILDTILNHGIHLGEIIQFVGESAVGKTTIALSLALSQCEQGYTVLYVDSEGSVSNDLLQSIGLMEYFNKKFIYVRKSTFKDVENELDKFISTGKVNFIYIDSIATLIHEGFVGQEKKDKSISITTNNTNFNSKRLCLFMNKYNSIAKVQNIGFILINQFRTKVNMIGTSTQKESGGKNVKYNSDIILKVKTLDTKSKFYQLTKSFNQGIALEFEIVKSNRRPPSKFPFYLVYGRGISNNLNDIFGLIENGYITAKGGCYSVKNGPEFKNATELHCFYTNHLSKNEIIEEELAKYYNKI